MPNLQPAMDEEQAFFRRVRQRLDESKKQVERLVLPDRAKEMVETCEPGIMCPICRNMLSNSVAVVPCGHTFCEECVTAWLDMHECCPTCRTHASKKTPTIRVRIVDELVQSIAQKSRNSVQEVVEEVSDLAATKANGDANDTNEAEMCNSCHSALASEVCGPCGSSLGLCRACAQIEAWQCENCEYWFCSDWCSAKPCVYCNRAHVCRLCSWSTLRKCPRPEC